MPARQTRKSNHNNSLTQNRSLKRPAHQETQPKPASKRGATVVYSPVSQSIPDIEASALRQGASAYLEKPFRLSAMGELVQQFLPAPSGA